MKDNRQMCASATPSACVVYTGPVLTQIDFDSLPCNANINDIIFKLDEVLLGIQSAINIEGVTLTCLDSCYCGPISIKVLFETIIAKLCEAIEDIKDLRSQLDNIGTTKFHIDLGDLGTPCVNSTNEYSLLEILSILVSEIKNLKNS